MAYCDICGNYDSEHTDGEPDRPHLQSLST